MSGTTASSTYTGTGPNATKNKKKPTHTVSSPTLRKRKKFFWQGRTAPGLCLFMMLTIVITIYRLPSDNDNHGRNNDTYVIEQSSDDEKKQMKFRTGEARVYDDPPPNNNNNGQGSDYPNDGGMVDNNNNNNKYLNEYLIDQQDEDGPAAGGGGGRLRQPNTVENNPMEDEQHLLVNGNIHLPPKFEALANVDDMLFQRGIDVPFYWHVPRSGGGTVNDVLGSCLHLTLAADAGGGEGHGQEETLKILHFGHSVSYVNVDTSTHQGISRAKNLNLVSSGLADVVISPLLHEASTLFTPTRRGRMFTIFRHPVERAASLFYFIQETQWKQPATRNDQFADISIEKFYNKGFAENNWMTRFLTNELTKGELTEKDLTIAKEVLRQKCLVGLLEEKGETFERVQKYFGWRPKSEEEQDCLEKKLEWAWPMKHKHPEIVESTRAWRLIEKANKFDLELYQYAQELFAQQGELLFPRGK